jgi:Na+/H+-dicarboxylate symporter
MSFTNIMKPLWFLLSAFDVRDVKTGNATLLSRIGAAVILCFPFAMASQWTGIEGLSPALLQLTGIGTDLFLGPIMVILPALIFISVTLGIANNDVNTLKGMGTTTLFYFFCTTIISVTVGALIMYGVNPAQWVSPEMQTTVQGLASNIAAAPAGAGVATDAFTSVREGIKSLLPENIVQEFLEKNFLTILIMAVVMGIAMLSIQAETVKTEEDTSAKRGLATSLNILNFCQKIVLFVVKVSMAFSPIAVISIMGNVIYETGLNALVSLGAYTLTIVLIMVVHTTGFFSSVLYFIAKLNPIKVFKEIKGLILVGAAASSSSAVMPMAIETAEKRGISKLVSKFVITLGATINMDGTAAYQAAAAVFLLVLFGIDPTFMIVAGIAFQAVLASVGTPGAPGVGMLILGGILAKHGIPIEALALILPVDRLLDMVRTGVNIYGDQVAASVMDRFYGEKPEEPFTDEDIQSQELLSTAQTMTNHNNNIDAQQK